MMDPFSGYSRRRIRRFCGADLLDYRLITGVSADRCGEQDNHTKIPGVVKREMRTILNVVYPKVAVAYSNPMGEWHWFHPS